MHFKINKPKVIHEVFDDEVVVVNLSSGSYYSLEKVGADIWGLVERGADESEIIEGIVQRYEGSREEIENAVNQLLTEFRQESLVVPFPTNGSENIGALSARAEIDPKTERTPFEAPVLHKYTDMEELLLLDPIHEVDETGWPSLKHDER